MDWYVIFLLFNVSFLLYYRTITFIPLYIVYKVYLLLKIIFYLKNTTKRLRLSFTNTFYF